MGAWCGDRYIPNLNPGDSCPTGGQASRFRGGMNQLPDEVQSSLTGSVMWNVNTAPVQMGQRPSATYSGGIPGPNVPNEIPFNEAQLYVNELRGQSRAGQGNQYDNFVSLLRRYTGSKLGTDGAVDSAWRKVLTDAQSAGVDAFELLTAGPSRIGRETFGAGGTRSGAAAYTGPIESVVVQAETDITAAAQAEAQQILGRTATDEEIQKIIRRTRSAETEQPDVRRQEGMARTVSEQGLTKEGRDAILRQVLMSSPDYASYQFDSTVMDMMLNNLRKGQEVARGTF